jgi:hypothetical protein
MSEDFILAERAEEWLEIGLRPAATDRLAAEKGVHLAYEAAGVAAPQRLLWLGSPMAAAVAVGLLQTGSSGPAGGVRGSVTTPGRVATSVADHASVWAALAAQGVSPGSVELGTSLRPSIRTRPWMRARAALVAQLGAAGYARHWLATGRRPWQQLVDQIAAPLRTRLGAQFAVDGGQLGKACQQALLDVIYGQHDAAWLAAFDEATPALAGLAQVARNAGWWWPFENVAVLSERHVEVHRDNLGRLHNGAGPALSYPDGFGLHSWRGMPIPPEVAAGLATLTVEKIQAETNAEVRRVMLEHFGFERYLRESGASKLHSDDYGILWRVDIPGDEPLVMVEVVNSSAEPDGSFRTYFLRVPPQTRTARAGVAWTFGLTEQEYAPEQQT